MSAIEVSATETPRTESHPHPSCADSELRRERSQRTHALFVECASADGQRLRQLYDELTVLNLPVADSIARRFAGRGIPMEDLEQVARLALVKVVRTFRLDFDRDFLAYAVPSIRGEVRKHFRDRAWVVRPPRRVQEGQGQLSAARSDLVQSLGRQPTVAELAARVGLDEDTVIECLASDSCYRPDRLDAPLGDQDGAVATLATRLGDRDAAFEDVEDRVTLAPALARLPSRDRLVLELRFFGGLTQSQIGERIGVSQMQVSRILSRVLGRLREDLTEDAAPWRAGVA